MAIHELYYRCRNSYFNELAETNREHSGDEDFVISDSKALVPRLERIGKKIKEFKYISDKFQAKVKEMKGQGKGANFEEFQRALKEKMAQLGYVDRVSNKVKQTPIAKELN
jgi:hypothetical protein